MHQPVVTNVATLRGYRQDLAMLESLSGLSPAFRSQVCSQILGGDSIPMLTVTYSRVIRVSTGTDVSFASSIDQSVMYSGRGRGRGRDRRCDFGGGGG